MMENQISITVSRARVVAQQVPLVIAAPCLGASSSPGTQLLNHLPGKAGNDGPSVWTLAIHARDQGGLVSS